MSLLNLSPVCLSQSGGRYDNPCFLCLDRGPGHPHLGGHGNGDLENAQGGYDEARHSEAHVKKVAGFEDGWKAADRLNADTLNAE